MRDDNISTSFLGYVAVFYVGVCPKTMRVLIEAESFAGKLPYGRAARAIRADEIGGPTWTRTRDQGIMSPLL